MMAGGITVKEGPVQKLKVDNNGFHTWESRHLILRPRSGQKPARFDWHFDESSYISSTAIQEFSHILLKHIDDKEHSFELVNKDSNRENVVIAVDDRRDLIDWMFAVHDLIDPALPFEEINKKVMLPEYKEMKPVREATASAPTFRVVVDDTTIAKNRGMAGRDFQVQLLPDLLVFSDIKTEKLTDFQYLWIRRYMKGLNNFTFETYSQCEIGGGVWRLLTSEASIINREFEKAANDAWRKYEKAQQKVEENGMDENTPLNADS